jgi:hypothetical protein
LACYAITGYNEPVRKRDQSAQKIQQEIEELNGEASGPPPAARREITRPAQPLSNRLNWLGAA